MRSPELVSARPRSDTGRLRQGTSPRTLFLAGASILAALVPLVLFAGLWLRNEFSESQRDVRRALETRAEAVSMRVDAAVREQITLLQALSTLPSLDEPDLAAFHDRASRIVARIPAWRTLVVIDPRDGRVRVDAARPFPPPSSPDPGETRFSESGFMVAEVAARAREAVATRSAVIAHPIRDGGTGTIPVLWPVTREGRPPLVLAAALYLDEIRRIVLAAAEEGRRVMLMDRERHPIVGAEGLAIAPEAEGRVFADDDALADGLTGIRHSPLTGWITVVSADPPDVDLLADRSIWATLIAGILSLAIAAALAVFLTHNILQRRLADERLATTRKLGDLDARLLATAQEALAEQRKAASEREVLLREVYHRVKNNLQIVQSLVRLGSRDLTPAQREPFEIAVRRIGAMARVHTLLYASPDLASIDFRDYLEGLLRELADAYGAEERGIETLLDASPVRVPLDTAVPLAFIAVELLTNAYKHAFPDARAGTVRITLREEGDKGVLTIVDTGVGVGSAGTGARRPLGLVIVDKLVQQIGGTLVPPRPGRSDYRLVFPLEIDMPVTPPTAPKIAPMSAALRADRDAPDPPDREPGP